MGVGVQGGRVQIDNTVVRRTTRSDAIMSAAGIGVESFVSSVARADLSNVVLHDNAHAQIAGLGAQLEVATSELDGSGVDAVGALVLATNDNVIAGHATLSGISLKHSVLAALFASGSDVTIEDSVVEDTKADALENRYGDAIAASAQGVLPATLRSARTRVDDSARAAVASFGAAIQLDDNLLRCQTFDLVGEPWEAFTSSFAAGGMSRCGCPDAGAECVLSTVGLTPPDISGRRAAP